MHTVSFAPYFSNSASPFWRTRAIGSGKSRRKREPPPFLAVRLSRAIAVFLPHVQKRVVGAPSDSWRGGRAPSLVPGAGHEFRGLRKVYRFGVVARLRSPLG